VPRDPIADAVAPFRIGVPLIATSRVVEAASAERLLAAGAADAVGMTRALIADPDLPRKAFAGRADEIVRCNGCNACIAHYHAGTPIACAVNPRTGRERSLPLPSRAANGVRVVVVGGGPAGLSAAAEAAAGGHEVVLLESGTELGGQLCLARGTPGGAEIADTLITDLQRRLARLGVGVRCGTAADAVGVLELQPAAVVVATGASPFRPPLPLGGVETLHAWDVLSGTLPRGRTVVVADWGGDPSGLDAAETLAAAGLQVTLATASVAIGEGVHQYRRNLYLRRLYGAGVTVEHHLTLDRAEPGCAVFRNTFAPELETAIATESLVLALGRVPEDALAGLDAAGVAVERAGDCLSPRSIEEAVLEGTLAARRVLLL
jgi:NADPH-dependent 2,4-dienoyl-CoA reductase/sulfur reductase-like enzyme